MLDQGGGRKASPSWFRRQFLADTRASKIKGKTWTLIRRCFDRICLQYRPQMIYCTFDSWNLCELNDCGNKFGVAQPRFIFYLVGRPTIKVSLTTKRNIPWVELVLRTMRFGRLHNLAGYTIWLVTQFGRLHNLRQTSIYNYLMIEIWHLVMQHFSLKIREWITHLIWFSIIIRQ